MKGSKVGRWAEVGREGGRGVNGVYAGGGKSGNDEAEGACTYM